MRKLFSILVALSFSLLAAASSVTYTADNTSIFRNPERGFTEEIGGETQISDASPYLLVGDAEDWYFDETGERETQSLVVLIYYLNNYRQKELSNTMLAGFDADMQVLRDKGFKCILRFAYNWNSKTDATLEYVKKHITKLKPHLKDNADVIYALETGFVGQWGEWYYTKNFTPNESQHLTDARRVVIDSMLSACPSDRFLLVRYPMIKKEYFNSTTALTSSQAFTGVPKARIGHHNDAFLNAYGNDGTYVSWDDEDEDSQEVRQFIANETLYVPNGGETNVEDDNDEYPNLSETVYSQAPSEMKTYHWSFCGSTYAEQVTQKWRTRKINGEYIYNILDRNMGYRYQLVSGTYSDQASAGGSMSVNMQIKNVGYAPLYNFRHAYIVLKNGNNTYSIQLTSDPRRWLPDATTTINETLTVPSNVPNGTYQLYLHMPDTAYRLAADPRFAIRFANKLNNNDIWDSTLGMNSLGASITIANGGAATPTLSLSANSVSFGNATVGSTTTRTFTVTGANLTNDVTVSSNNAALTVSPTSITKANAQSGATVTLSLTPTATGSGSATVTVASSGATSKSVSVSWTGTSSGSGGGGGSSNAIELPATLNKDNKSATSDDTWWANDATYFDFGSTDGDNTSRYIEWNIYLHYPGQYNISAVAGFPNDGNADGFTLQLELISGNTTVSTFTGDNTWATANITYTTKWDLSSISAGEYTIRAKNIAEYEQPKLKSVTLQYDGVIPTDPDPIPDPDPSGNQVTYTVDNSTIFANPERGFYYHYEKVLTTNSPYAVKNNTGSIDSHAGQAGSLILIVYYLDNFKTTATLPSTIINAFDEDMAALRSKGFKCIVRYAYTASNANETAEDAQWSIVKQHISQLKPKWQANADVIFCFQIGFVGAWGEWYYSKNFGNKATQINTNRRLVVDSMLAAVPSDRCILIRTPLFKTSYMGSTAPLTESEAYTGTPKSRIGHHNDAFLKVDYGDEGTYSDTATQKPYLAQETLYVPIGGETNETDETAAITKAAYNTTIAETSRLHYTFVNQGYSTAMTNVWRSNGAYDALRKWLGYRYQLLNGTYSSQATPGGDMSVYMQIKNVGFAPLYNERPVFIVLKNSSHTYQIQMEVDPRTWKPNGVVSTVSEVLTLPSNIATGTYQLYLYLPDAYENLRSDSRYSVRFANSNMWDSTNGWNSLNASIVITNTPSTPALTVSPTSVAFGDVMRYSSDTRSLTVTGTNLTGNVTVSSNNAALTVSPATISQADATNGATVTLTVSPTVEGNGSATVTIASNGATNKTVNVTWNGTAVSGYVELPATLNKVNVSTISNDMTYYATDPDYFDFGPEDDPNTERWAKWNVYLSYPSEYTISAIVTAPSSGTGHEWSLRLINAGGDTIDSYNTLRTWTIGEVNYSAKWDLSNVPAGVYTLLVRNAFPYAQPKLKSLTLECEALLTSHTVTWNAGTNGGTCATATSQIPIGDAIGTLPTATKSGYIFIGWFSQATNGSLIKTTTIPTSNVTYYAQFLPIPQVSTPTVNLPNTLNKGNVGLYSDNMAWEGTNNENFDFATGGTNLYGWAAWRVNLLYPGSYTVTEETKCSNRHQYILQLFNGNTLVSEYTTTQVDANTDYQVYEQSTPWDLSNLPAGNYVLMVRNPYDYSEPKLKRITLFTDVPCSATITVTTSDNAKGTVSIQ